MEKSESIKELAVALSKFQGDILNPKNTAINPSFNSKYAPLSEVINTTRQGLAKNGLSIVQAPYTDGDNVIVETFLLHSSGEWISAPPLCLKMERVTAQGAGSAIIFEGTRARHQVNKLFNILNSNYNLYKLYLYEVFYCRSQLYLALELTTY